MSSLISSVIRSVTATSLVLALVGCGGGGTTNDGGTDVAQNTDTPGSDTMSGGGNAAHGMALVNTNICGSCHTGSHGTLAGGDAIPAGNLTPDPTTGLGNWTDAQIIAAIRNGTRNDGTTLCATMTRYATTLSESDAQDIVAYLRTLPSVSFMAMHCATP